MSERADRADGAATADEQPGARVRDPWAPPERRVPLDEPTTGALPEQRTADAPGRPGHAVPPPHAAVPPAHRAGPPGAPSAVPPVPPAPTGPGTPSAYPGGPWGQGPYPQGYPQGPVNPQAPYATTGYGYPVAPAGQIPYGAPPYGGPVPYGQVPYQPGSYGYPVPAFYGEDPRAMGSDSGFGVAALVLGIVGTVMSVTVLFGALLGILGVIFGAIGRSKVKNGRAFNGGQALTGLILGALAFVLSAVMLFVYISVSDDEDGYVPEDDPGATYGAYVSAPLRPGPAAGGG
ncbi:DUF4190 domain-containing protein [Streptomyces sp. HU2014]|uniref:DUF4190 domain-containing protein n=1 Tax=Streptomyces sp. HU2014 TaxID=2939414 RepID=UPI00200CC392|nr:DUF4190 domain-containing protein [Streptomyces sp. HU2014]UQI47613.1 DUF4190 domain-containing protein [Streptomyces sp. HU2014]